MQALVPVVRRQSWPLFIFLSFFPLVMFPFLFCSPLLSSFVLYHISLAFIFLSLKKDFRAEKSKQVTIHISQVTQVDLSTRILHS
jgi:hypothetical protein